MTLDRAMSALGLLSYVAFIVMMGLAVGGVW